MTELEEKVQKIYRMNNEIFYSIKFHDSIKGSFIPENLSLSLSGGAIDYSGAYVLFRILNDFRPKKILELGLGQSTKIISCYVKENDGRISHRCVEHDNSWIEFFLRSNCVAADTEIIKLNVQLKEIEIKGKKSNTYIYTDFAEQLKDIQYDFIMIDAPYGWNNPVFSRIDSLELIGDNLSKSFVIFLHDVLREGERNTFELLKGKLDYLNIKYRFTIYENTGIIVSDDNKFLCTM